MIPRLSRLLIIGIFLVMAAIWHYPIGSADDLTVPGWQLHPAGPAGTQHTSALPTTGRLAVAAPTACYSWDFLNNTGQDASGLVVRLKGIPQVTQVYTGTLNPFGAPDPSSGYDAGKDVYSLVFGGGSVPDSGMAQVGLCAASDRLRLAAAPAPAFTWIVSGTAVTPAPLFAGLDFTWKNPDHLQAHLYNDQAITLTAFSFTALLPEGPLELEDLNDGVTSGLPSAGEEISGTLELKPGASASFDIYFNQGGVQVPYGAPVVIEAQLSNQADPTDAIHLLAQTAQPLRSVYAPLVQKQ